MAGGQGWFSSTDTPMTSEVIKLLAGGAYRHVSSGKWKGLDIHAGTVEAAAGRSLTGMFPEIPGAGFEDDNKDQDESVVADFGFLREFAKRAAIQDWTPNTPLLYDGGPMHPHGPHLTAYTQVLDAYRNAVPKFTQFLARTQPTVSLPTSTELDAIIAKVTSNTSVWGSEDVGSDTVGEWEWIEGLFGTDKLLETIIDAAKISIVAGEATPVAVAVEEPLDGWPSAAVTITEMAAHEKTFVAPTMGDEYSAAVDVADLVDDAVSAFEALDEIRFAAHISEVQALFSGARAVMTTTFDDALVLANAEKAARSAAYDKDLRAAFVKDTVAAEIDHRHTTLYQRAQNGQLAIAHFQAIEEAKWRKSAIDVQIGDIYARISMANADATNRRLLANAEAANRAAIANAEMKSRANIAGREIPAGIAAGIMSSAVSWMHARAIPVTNAGAIASVIGTMYDAKLKNTVASSELSAKYFMDTFSGLASWAQGWNATGQTGWNSLTSNMELYRAAIATASGVPGTIHRDSTFNVATQAIAGGLGAVSGIANIAMALS